MAVLSPDAKEGEVQVGGRLKFLAWRLGDLTARVKVGASRGHTQDFLKWKARAEIFLICGQYIQSNKYL